MLQDSDLVSQDEFWGALMVGVGDFALGLGWAVLGQARLRFGTVTLQGLFLPLHLRGYSDVTKHFLALHLCSAMVGTCT